MKTICKSCGQEFSNELDKYHPTNRKFCNKKCSIKYFNDKHRQPAENYPKFICGRCQKVIQLDFFPAQNKNKWLNFKCPNCKMIQKTHLNIIPTGGYIPDKPDKRNYSFGAVFGAPEYPRKFIRELPPVNIPYQKNIPSCVVCSFTFLNEYKSFINEGSNLNLSWRRPFSQTGAYNSGRTLKDVAKYLQGSGQPQDQFCDDNPDLSEAKFMHPVITSEVLDDEIKRVIGGYWWIRPDNIAELCAAVVKEPIIITLGGVNQDWQKPYNEIITHDDSAGYDWYHAIVLLDYDLDAGYFRIVNWWGDQLRKLSINYKLMSAMSFADIPDENDMLKVIKLATSEDQYVITGNVKRRIPDSDTFHYFKGQLGVIGDFVIVSQAEFNQYQEAEILPSVKLMRALGDVAKDIFLKA